MPSCRSIALIGLKLFQSAIWGMVSSLICQLTLDYTINNVFKVFAWDFIKNDVFQLEDQKLREQAQELSPSDKFSRVMLGIFIFTVVTLFMTFYLDVYALVKQEQTDRLKEKSERASWNVTERMARNDPVYVKMVPEETDPFFNTIARMASDQHESVNGTHEWQNECREHWAAQKAYMSDSLDEKAALRASFDNVASEIKKCRRTYWAVNNPQRKRKGKAKIKHL